MGDRRAIIEDWIPSAEPNVMNSDKPAGQGFPGSSAYKNIEHEILGNFYSLGKQHFEAAEYQNAEQFLCRFLTMHGPSPDDDYSRRNDAREMLATSLIKQRKLSDAERILLSLLKMHPRKIFERYSRPTV